MVPPTKPRAPFIVKIWYYIISCWRHCIMLYLNYIDVPPWWRRGRTQSGRTWRSQYQPSQLGGCTAKAYLTKSLKKRVFIGLISPPSVAFASNAMFLIRSSLIFRYFSVRLANFLSLARSCSCDQQTSGWTKYQPIITVYNTCLNASARRSTPKVIVSQTLVAVKCIRGAGRNILIISFNKGGFYMYYVGWSNTEARCN